MPVDSMIGVLVNDPINSNTPILHDDIIVISTLTNFQDLSDVDDSYRPEMSNHLTSSIRSFYRVVSQMKHILI